MTSEREAARRAFLAGAGLGDARREPLAGDASTRRYERLHPARGPSLILMDQPPAVESHPCPPAADADERAALGYNALARLAAGRVDAFVACAGYLRDLGLSAPEIIAADPAAGLAVLEDLGDDLYARLIEAGADETPLYDAAVDVLVAAARGDAAGRAGRGRRSLAAADLRRPGPAHRRRPVPRMVAAPAPGAGVRRGGRAEWEALWAPIRARGEAGASVFCHRDYHAENLIWLPDRRGAARVGLLDFQDALRAHPAWDLSMLLHDARRDVSAEREAAVLARYLAARPEVDRDAFLADYHGLGALNIVRILGLFARLVVRDSKPRYGP